MNVNVTVKFNIWAHNYILGITWNWESDWTVFATKCKKIFNVTKYLQEFWFPKDVGYPWYDKDNNSPTYVRLETHFDNQEQRSGKFIMTKSRESYVQLLLDNSNKQNQKARLTRSAGIRLDSYQHRPNWAQDSTVLFFSVISSF